MCVYMAVPHLRPLAFEHWDPVAPKISLLRNVVLRSEEIEALQQANAILSGAKFEAFLQGV